MIYAKVRKSHMPRNISLPAYQDICWSIIGTFLWPRHLWNTFLCRKPKAAWVRDVGQGRHYRKIRTWMKYGGIATYWCLLGPAEIHMVGPEHRPGGLNDSILFRTGELLPRHQSWFRSAEAWGQLYPAIYVPLPGLCLLIFRHPLKEQSSWGSAILWWWQRRTKRAEF